MSFVCLGNLFSHGVKVLRTYFASSLRVTPHSLRLWFNHTLSKLRAGIAQIRRLRLLLSQAAMVFGFTNGEPRRFVGATTVTPTASSSFFSLRTSSVRDAHGQFSEA